MDRDVIVQEEPIRVRPFELIHAGHFDIVINKLPTNREKAQELIARIQTNLSADPDQPLAGWTTRMENQEKRYLDNDNKPKYFAKRKWMTWEKFQRYQKPHTKMLDKRVDQALNSLLSEFHISGEIRRVVDSDEFQEVARRNGFRSIRLAEPLVGFIDRKTCEKTVIYEYQEGEPGLTRPDGENDPDFNRQVIHDFVKILTQHGIVPIDLRDQQLLVRKDSDGTDLILIDIEGYFVEREPENMASIKQFMNWP